MLERIRARVQSIFEMIALAAVRLHLSPSAVSALGVFFSGLGCVLFSLSHGRSGMLIAAGASILFSGLCDSLDGSVARLKGEVTELGGFMDSTLDRYSDSLIIGGLIAGRLVDSLWGIAALVGSLLTSYTRARAEAVGVKLSGVGLLERAERLLIVAGSALIQGAFPDLTVLPYGVALIAVLSHATVVQRVIYVGKALRKSE